MSRVHTRSDRCSVCYSAHFFRDEAHRISSTTNTPSSLLGSSAFRGFCPHPAMNSLAIAVLLSLIGPATAQAPPFIAGARWAPSTPWSAPGGANPCPPGLPWPCNVGDSATVVTVVGSNFGGATGSVGVAASIPVPAPAPIPWDLPGVLSLQSLTPGSWQNGCLANSDWANPSRSFQVCPYATTSIWTLDGVRLSSLGSFAGVTRAPSLNCNATAVPPEGDAVTGLLFAGGDVCNGRAASATVRFVCIDEADPWQTRYTDGGGGRNAGGGNISVYAASSSADGCDWTLDVPLPDACSDNFNLCAALVPTPAPVPTAAPSFAFNAPTLVTAWTPDTVTTLVQTAAMPPSAVRLQRADGALSAAIAPSGPGPLPPSASPVPVPFPTQLTVTAISPGQYVSTDNEATQLPCQPVTFTLAGVLPSDLAGFDSDFSIIFPRSPNLNATEMPLQNVPSGANGAPAPIPANGILSVVLECAPTLLTGFPTLPLVAPFFLRSRFFNTTIVDGAVEPTNEITHRDAVCPPSGCTWTFCGDVCPTPTSSPTPSVSPTQSPTPSVSPSLSQTPSQTPSQSLLPPPASDTILGISPAAFYGSIGGSVAFVVIVAVFVTLWLRRSVTSSAAVSKAVAKQRTAWSDSTPGSVSAAVATANPASETGLALTAARIASAEGGGGASPSASVRAWGEVPKSV